MKKTRVFYFLYLSNSVKCDINIQEGENMVDLTKSVQYIKGVGPAKAKLLEKLRDIYS